MKSFKRRKVSHALPLLRLNKGDREQVLNKKCFEALNNLAASRNRDLQKAAAMYYQHLSHYLECPLPAPFMEPLMELLLSTDLDVQKTACLSLVNLLVKNNVCKELVCEMGMLSPLLEMIQCGDQTARCHSCACMSMLASSELNSDLLVSDGVIPLLVLAKSYDPQIQQNAAWVLLNLTQSDRSRRALCRVGALPVLALLLQSSDSRVQFYGCAALSNMAAVQEHRRHMLGIGENYLLKSLLTLMSSPVQKNASQACKCLQMLCKNVGTQEQLMELDCVWPLKTLVSSSGLACALSALRLLSTLSTHPPNHEVLVSEGVLDVIAQLLQLHRSSSDVIIHSCTTIAALSISCTGQQAVMESQCLLVLLRVMGSPVTSEDSLICISSCLHRLMSLDTVQSHMSTTITSEEVLGLVMLSGPTANPQLAYNSTAIIGKLQMNGEVIRLLRPHYRVLVERLLSLFKCQEVRLQHLGVTTLCNLIQDGDFGAFLAGSELEAAVLRIHAQTEEMRQLLRSPGLLPPPSLM